MKKEMGFQEIKEAIENAPITYLPALLLVAVEACMKRKVFKDSAALVRVVVRKVNVWIGGEES